MIDRTARVADFLDGLTPTGDLEND
jgi:hypothetical protein